ATVSGPALHPVAAKRNLRHERVDRGVRATALSPGPDSDLDPPNALASGRVHHGVRRRRDINVVRIEITKCKAIVLRDRPEERDDGFVPLPAPDHPLAIDLVATVRHRDESPDEGAGRD